jgi:hypothetical protein
MYGQAELQPQYCGKWGVSLSEKWTKAFADVKPKDIGEPSSGMASGSYQQGFDFHQIDQVVKYACISPQE